MLANTHYQHSGAAPFGGILMALVIGLIAAAVLGAVYTYLIFYIPFVYINFFVTIGFGVLLGIAVGSGAKIGKIRNSGVVGFIALIAGLVGYYIHWVFWVGAAMEARSFDPSALWTFISAINAIGPWSIFGWTPSGFSLWAIWGIEALMMIGIAVLGARGMTDIPYCEQTGQWASENVLPRRFAALAEGASVDSVSAVLSQLNPVDDNSAAYTEVTTFTADGSELRCASIESVVVETDKDGKESTKKTTLARHLLFDRDSFDKLLQMGQASAAPAAAAGLVEPSQG